MSYLKRQNVPKSWPIPRKGTAYVVRPSSGLNTGIPVLVILRNILKVAQTKKEVKNAINQKAILVNSKRLKDERQGIFLLDTLSLIPNNKHYRLELNENGKFSLKEIKLEESLKKISKIVNKKMLKGKKRQLNLMDGGNILSDIKCKVNDSILINLKENKIEKCLPLEKKAKVMVFSGKHSGEYGNIKEIDENKKMVKIDSKKGPLNILIKQLIVIE